MRDRRGRIGSGQRDRFTGQLGTQPSRFCRATAAPAWVPGDIFRVISRRQRGEALDRGSLPTDIGRHELAPPGFLDELKTRVSLSQVVGRKVMWDRRKSNQAKGDMWAPCPFHQEKNRQFSCG